MENPSVILDVVVIVVSASACDVFVAGVSSNAVADDVVVGNSLKFEVFN